jgi:prepilin-type N-terminal cleavage/methylation domain-containing protein
MRRRASSRTARPGFTLIELLVVLGIIGILIGITLVVGKQVRTSSQTRLTQDTIRVLDSAVQAYKNATGDLPPPLAAVDPAQPTMIFPAIDGRDMSDMDDGTITPGGHQMVNSVGIFYFQAAQVPESKAVLDKLPSRVVQVLDVDGPGAAQPRLTTVIDAWNHPIRYVHPMFQGDVMGSIRNGASNAGNRKLIEMFETLPAGQQYRFAEVRRNHVQGIANPARAEDWPDSDGGSCIGGTPYFYSAGPDGLVGTATFGGVTTDYNVDNVYTVQPKRPQVP